MARIININALKVCDVILTTSTEKVSKAVRFATNTDVSHAMICVSHGSVIDSTKEGVQARNVQKMFYDDSCSIHIMRYKNNLKNHEKEKIIEYVRSVIGTPYSVKDAIRSIIDPEHPCSDLQFCSRLVAVAFQKAGICITDKPEYCTPGQIKRFSLFFEVENPFITISESDRILFESEETTLDDMRKITNKLIKLCIEASEDNEIHCINDIFKKLYEKPILDKIFLQAFKDSGYLDHWRKEVERFPWRYDKNKMDLFVEQDPFIIKEVINYCNYVIKSDRENAFSHWETCYKDFLYYSKTTNLETFKLNAELYRNLIELKNRRVKLAKEFLTQHS